MSLFERVPPFLVLALVIGIMFLPISLAIVSTVAVVVLSAILIISLKRGTAAYTFFTNPKIVYIGLISYSLYLWHWGVLSISRWTIGIHWWSIPLQVILIFALANASYKYIETPLRKGNFFGKRWQTIVFGGGLILMLSGGLIALIEPLKGKLYTGKKLDIKTFERPPKLVGEKCLENISKNTSCIYIDNESINTIWMLGDSHANTLELTGEQVSKNLRMNLKIYSASGTAFPSVTKYRKAVKERHLQSLSDFRLVEKELYKQIKFGDIVLLSMRMPYHFGGTYYELPPSDFVFVKKDGSFGSQENYFDEWIGAVVNLANKSEEKGTKIIIQTPTPEWEKELNKLCTKNNEWFNKLQIRNCQIKSKFFIDEETGIYKHMFKKLNQLSSSHKNIYLFDTYKIVCPEKICGFTMKGVDIYLDDDHISPKWAKDELSPRIYKFIRTISD